MQEKRRHFARCALANTAERPELLKDSLSLDDLFLARRVRDTPPRLCRPRCTQCYKLRRPIAVTSNRVVRDWGKYLSDVTMASTILDRLQHRCAMLEFDGKSSRL